ncbi:MAG: hypothetical protein RJB60_848 [Pseudomonadota bacterium]|jgi:hypothetical protein
MQTTPIHVWGGTPWWRTAFVALLIALSALAHAGRPCDDKATTPKAVELGLGLASRTATQLDALKAHVVVLARVGQDLSEYGLRYSHLGLAYKEGNVWRVVHKLNQCGTDKAYLYRQGLGEFFLDSPFEYVAGIMVLSPEAQEQLLPVLRDNAKVQRMNTRAYSMLAYPWAQQYQQSNQWALETLAMAWSPDVSSREQAQAWLKLKGYEPTELHLSTLKRLGARVTTANISFDDHPPNLRFSSRIRTITVDSVFDWLQRNKLGQPPVLVR